MVIISLDIENKQMKGMINMENKFTVDELLEMANALHSSQWYYGRSARGFDNYQDYLKLVAKIWNMIEEIEKEKEGE